jgi:hypothetical protein
MSASSRVSSSFLPIWVSIAVVASSATALEVTTPAGCDRLPEDIANLCKREITRSGEFRYKRLTKPKECLDLTDSVSRAQCPESIRRDGAYLAASAPEAPSPSAEAPSTMDRTPTAPLTLEERNTQALEKIATYTKLQSLVFTTLTGVGLVLAVVIAAAN